MDDPLTGRSVILDGWMYVDDPQTGRSVIPRWVDIYIYTHTHTHTHTHMYDPVTGDYVCIVPSRLDACWMTPVTGGCISVNMCQVDVRGRCSEGQ